MPFNGAKVSSTLDLNFSVGQVLVCTGVEPCREDDPWLVKNSYNSLAFLAVSRQQRMSFLESILY